MNKNYTCCFFGHRKIKITDELTNNLKEIIERLIKEKNINTFLFGSKSKFDELCLEIVTQLKNKYPYIKRVYVRAEFPYIDESYTTYILKQYEYTYYPQHIINAGKAAYVERNYEMIDNSSYCIIYYDKNYNPPRRNNSKKDLFDYQPNSGTRLAYNYAVNKNIHVINILNNT